MDFKVHKISASKKTLKIILPSARDNYALHIPILVKVANKYCVKSIFERNTFRSTSPRFPILPERTAAESEKITNANCFENTTRHRDRMRELRRTGERREGGRQEENGEEDWIESKERICRHLPLPTFVVEQCCGSETGSQNSEVEDCSHHSGSE